MFMSYKFKKISLFFHCVVLCLDMQSVKEASWDICHARLMIWNSEILHVLHFALSVYRISDLLIWKVWSIYVPAICSTFCLPCRPCKLNETELKDVDMDHDHDSYYAKKVKHQVIMELMLIVMNASLYFLLLMPSKFFLPFFPVMWNKHWEKLSLSTLMMQL